MQMVRLMPLSLTVFCISKIQVVPEKGPLNGCCCCCCCIVVCINLCVYDLMCCLEMDSAGDTMGVQSLQDLENYLMNFNKEISDITDHRFVLAAASASNNPLYTDISAIDNSSSSSVAGMKIEWSGLHAGVDSGAGDQTNFDLSAGADGLIGQVSPQQLLALHGAPVGATPVTVTRDDMDQEDGNVDSHLEQAEDDSFTQASGAGSFHTVTIVPSEVNSSGEVCSYVLTVSQQEGKDDDDVNADLSVHDFKQEAKNAVESGDFYQKVKVDRQAKKPCRRVSMVRMFYMIKII